MNDLRENAMVVLYDGNCGFCKVMLAVLLRWDRGQHLDAVPIQCTLGEQLLIDMSPQDRLESWHLLDGAQALHSGGAAIPLILAALPRGALLARVASRFPRTTSRTYEWVAGHRVLLGRLLRTRTRAWAARVVAERGRSDQNSYPNTNSELWTTRGADPRPVSIPPGRVG